MMDQHNMGQPIDRYLSRIDVFAMALGVMVGWGAFVLPGTTFLPVAGPAGTIIGLAIGVLIMLVVVTNFTFLMQRSPRTGGVYAYTKMAFGRDHAFLSSWFLCLSYLTIVFLNGTALFIVVRTMGYGVMDTGIHYSIAGNEVYLTEVLISVFAFALVGILFLNARPFLQKLYSALAFILVIGVLIIAVICVPHALTSKVVGDFGTKGLNRAYAVFMVVLMAPWAFVGFDVVSFDTAYFKFPLGRVRRTLYASIIVAGLLYIAMAIVGVSFVPDGYASWGAYLSDLDQIAGVASVPTFNAVKAYMGTAGLWIIAITALAAIFTGIIGAYRAAMRILSTMAEDHILSRMFMETKNSILFIMIISVTLSMLGRNTLNWFVDLTSFGAIVGFGYTCASAYKIARAENNRVIMATGIAGSIISAAFGIVQLLPHMTAMETMGSEAFLLLALWCLLGFLFYMRTVNETTLAEFTGMSTSGIVLFALLLYSALMWIGKQLAANANDAIERTLTHNGIVLMLLIFVGLAAMMHIQNKIRKKHEVIEREKIRAVESNLARSQFLFNMSHDIRTPMNAIVGYTNLALKENDPSTLHEYLAKIDTSSHHLLTLITDILEMSRFDGGNIELEYVPTDISALFDEMRELYADQMEEKGIGFTVHASQIQDKYVWCDKKNLTRVLLNVISNALKFTSAGGTVGVSLLETGSAENGYGSYEIRVQDSGIGMSREFVEKVFTAFERERTSTDSGVEGTGLGLAITKSIVDLMGGTIEVHSTPGSGTEIVIRVRFQLAKETDMPKEEVATKDSGEEKTVDFNQMRLLLVEDNMINMEIANMILTQLGFTVETAENGQIGVDMVAASEPGYYDLILMDIQMPVMDGYEATKMIRSLECRQLSEIPIIAMTANAYLQDMEETKKAGMNAHLCKPIDLKTLVKLMYKYIL